jgi:hypothetical protein
MKSLLYGYSEKRWQILSANRANIKITPQLVLCFAAKSILENQHIYETLKAEFPAAQIAFCSTAGEIANNAVSDNSLKVVALEFEKTGLQSAAINIRDYSSSYEAGLALVKKLPIEDLSYILVLSDGHLVNGSELVKGLNESAPENVLVTGGLAGDSDNFNSTLVGLNQVPSKGEIIAIGLYGKNIKVSHGTQGGWDSFGIEKVVTKATGNKLYDLDDKNVLDMYKKYLGPEANRLPASALLYPLSVLMPGNTEPIVRTILSINDEENSLIFAGDIPENSRIRFMKANLDKIITAAGDAAQDSLLDEHHKPDFSLLVSCVGRKLILGPRTDEEIEAVQEVFGNETTLAGFYSYGEISPFVKKGDSQLHNQTMTITSFYEL